MTLIHRVHETDFDGPRLRKKGRYVVLFQGPWCPFSQTFRVQYAHLQPPSGVHLAEYIMEDFYEKTPLMFDIEVIPTVIAFVDGVIAWRHSGIPNRGLGEPTVHRIEKWGTEPQNVRAGPPPSAPAAAD
jgi:thiol-disulfide isomerase/thioredoxin